MIEPAHAPESGPAESAETAEKLTRSAEMEALKRDLHALRRDLAMLGRSAGARGRGAVGDLRADLRMKAQLLQEELQASCSNVCEQSRIMADRGRLAVSQRPFSWLAAAFAAGAVLERLMSRRHR